MLGKLVAGSKFWFGRPDLANRHGRHAASELLFKSLAGDSYHDISEKERDVHHAIAPTCISRYADLKL